MKAKDQTTGPMRQSSTFTVRVLINQHPRSCSLWENINVQSSQNLFEGLQSVKYRNLCVTLSRYIAVQMSLFYNLDGCPLSNWYKTCHNFSHKTRRDKFSAPSSIILTVVRSTVCCSHNLPKSLIRQYCIPLTGTVRIDLFRQIYYNILLYFHTKHSHNKF